MSVEIKNLLGTVYTINNMPTGGAKALKYTTIGRLLYWLNESFMLKDENGKVLNSFYVGKHDYECKPQDDNREYRNENTFLTFENHFCTAVDKFILPKVGQERKSPFFIKYASEDLIKELIFGDGTDILDILINLEYIQNQFESKLTSVEESSINIYEFVKDILQDMTNDFGYINQFDIHLRDNTLYYLVDRKVTAGKKDLQSSIIDLVGLGSTATNINLTSNLTNETATFSVISAATIKSDIPSENSAMMSWNRGLQDRFIKEKFVVQKKESRTKALRDKIIALQGYCYYINKDLQRLPDVSSVSLEASHKAVMTELVAELSFLKKVSPPGMIPIQLSFEVLGISGINIGQGFILEKGILPESYEGRVSFIVGGVSHKVSDNRWTTELTCYMSMIDIAESLTEKGRPSVVDLINGSFVEKELKRLNEQSAEEVTLALAAADESTTGQELFNVLAEKALGDKFTPTWPGFRAAKINDVTKSGLGIYYNTSEDTSRRGLINDSLDALIAAAIREANRKINATINQGIERGGVLVSRITKYHITSGGQISSATLEKYNITDAKSINRVRVSNESDTKNHDNGWAADIELRNRKDAYSIYQRDSKNSKIGTSSINIVNLFIEAFFNLALQRGKVPRIGVGNINYMNDTTIHVGFFNAKSPAISRAATIFSKNKKIQNPAFAYLNNPYLKSVYQQAYTKYGKSNIALIPRGKAT